jgi:hypothetical protein
MNTTCAVSVAIEVAPRSYAVTIPVAAASRTEAEAFVRFLLSEKGMAMFERAGFHRFSHLRAAGDAAAIPQSIRSMLGQRMQ